MTTGSFNEEDLIKAEQARVSINSAALQELGEEERAQKDRKAF